MAEIRESTEDSGWEALLIKGLFEIRPQNPILRNFYEEVFLPTIQKTSGDFGRCWLNGVPFADRAALREHLQSLAAGDGLRVLIILGEEGAGKTHSRRRPTKTKSAPERASEPTRSRTQPASRSKPKRRSTGSRATKT